MSRRTAAAGHAQSRTDRMAQWWSGWRVAVVTAGRDARRHRGTTVLIMVMIGLPVLLITGFGTVMSTTSISPAERLHWELGHATAKVMPPSVEGNKVIQSPDGSTWTSTGWDKSDTRKESRTWTSAQVAQAVGGQAYAVENGTAAVSQDGRPLVVSALTLSPGGFAATGVATLKTGSWPTAQDQILVSPELVSRGVPSSGAVSISVRGKVETMTVVGTAEGTNQHGEAYGLMGLSGAFSGFLEKDSSAFLIMRPQPFTWSEIQQLNTQGFVVVVPEFVLHPDRADLNGAYAAQGQTSTDPIDVALVALMIFGLLLETTLLAGPAFAVSTAKRRRTLALVASNGATRQQLRRYVLGQGLVMGVLSATAGASLGLALPAIGFPAADHILGARVARGPFQPNWPVLAASAIAAVFAALVAASMAARGTSRLDIAQTLAGRARTPARQGIRRLALPVIAALATTGALAGCAIITLAPDPPDTLTFIALLSIIATLGSLFLVGTVVDLVGRLRRGPIATRIALRDGRRNRSRTLPAVAAITATVTVLTMMTIAITSGMAQRIRDYAPQAPYGDGLVYTHPAAAGGRATLAEVHRQHPEWSIQPISQLGSDVKHADRLGRTAALVPTGCGPAAVLDGTAPNPCAIGYDSTIAPADAAVTKLPAAAAEAVTKGTAVLVDHARLVHDGHVTVAVSDHGTVRAITLPALLVPSPVLSQAFPTRDRTTPWIPPALAARQHLPVTQTSSLIHDPDGPITRADEKAINERVTGIGLQVERGPLVGPIRLLLVGMLAVGGLLALIAALIATALGRAESRADLATFAALGASGFALRRIASAQALMICLIGTAQGLLTGLLPGMALAAAMTGHATGNLPPHPIIDIPWAQLLGGLGAAAILMGLLAALTIRRLPLTRRIE